MEQKKWYMSKAIWAGVVTIIIALYNTLIAQLAAGCEIEGSICIVLPAIPVWAITILGALGIYGRAAATTTIK